MGGKPNRRTKRQKRRVLLRLARRYLKGLMRHKLLRPVVKKSNKMGREGKKMTMTRTKRRMMRINLRSGTLLLLLDSVSIRGIPSWSSN